MNRFAILTAAVAALTGATASAQVSDAVIKNAFQLYEGPAPTAPNYEPGVRITTGAAYSPPER